MFQAGQYAITRTLDSATEHYGYLVIAEDGDDYALEFYGANRSTWPLEELPAGDPTASYTFTHTTEDPGDQTGAGTMAVAEWPQEFGSGGEPMEIGPGPIYLDVDGARVAIATIDGDNSATFGYYAVIGSEPGWPIGFNTNATATIRRGTADDPRAVVAQADAEFGRGNWERRALDETFS